MFMLGVDAVLAGCARWLLLRNDRRVVCVCQAVIAVG